MTDSRAPATPRPLTEDDQAEFLDLVAASAGLHRSWVALPSTPREFQAYLARYSHDGEEALLVRAGESGAIAGLVNLNSVIRGRSQNASVAYAAGTASHAAGPVTVAVAAR